MIFEPVTIMEYKGKIYLVQVKNTEDQASKSSKYPKYKKLDYFATPTNFGVTIINRNGKITKLNQEGEIVNDSE